MTERLHFDFSFTSNLHSTVYHPTTFLFFFFFSKTFNFFIFLSFYHHIWQKPSKGSDPGRIQPCAFSAFVLKQPSTLVVVGGIREQDFLWSHDCILLVSLASSFPLSTAISHCLYFPHTPKPLSILNFEQKSLLLICHGR